MTHTKAASPNEVLSTALAATEAPMIFLAGPPGSGKTTLGGQACEKLGLRFLDSPGHDSATPAPYRAVLDEAVRRRSADVVALSLQLQQDSKLLRSCRQNGVLVGLWAHPLEMQARSGRSAPLFTPVARLSTQGGFGRQGTGCREYRGLARACDEILLLCRISLDDAADALRAMIEELRAPDRRSPAEREGLLDWAAYWAKDYRADAKACEILVDAMARYVQHLRSRGASPRTLAAVYGDLNAAGLLVIRGEAPRAKKVLDAFSSAPCTYDFRRMISDSPAAMARYERTLEGFAAFLRAEGLIRDE